MINQVQVAEEWQGGGNMLGKHMSWGSSVEWNAD